MDSPPLLTRSVWLVFTDEEREWYEERAAIVEHLGGQHQVAPDGAWLYEDQDGGMHRAEDLRREGSSGRLEA